MMLFSPMDGPPKMGTNLRVYSTHPVMLPITHIIGLIQWRCRRRCHAGSCRARRPYCRVADHGCARDSRQAWRFAAGKRRAWVVGGAVAFGTRRVERSDLGEGENAVGRGVWLGARRHSDEEYAPADHRDEGKELRQPFGGLEPRLLGTAAGLHDLVEHLRLPAQGVPGELLDRRSTGKLVTSFQSIGSRPGGGFSSTRGCKSEPADCSASACPRAAC